DHGADPNAKDRNQGETPLMFAAGYGRADAVKALVARGADLNATSLVPTRLQPARGANPQQNGQQNGQQDQQQNAQRGQRGQRGGQQGQQAADNTQSAQNPQAVQNAQNANRGRAAGGRGGSTVLALGGLNALQFAARDGYRTTVETLVQAGADVNELTASDKM